MKKLLKSEICGSINSTLMHCLLWKSRLLFMYCSLDSNYKCWLFCGKQWSVYCLWTHKFHFSATFSLKMSPTVLFTYLKIILLQCFLVFSFQLYPNGPLTSVDFSKFVTIKKKKDITLFRIILGGTRTQ